MARGCTVYLYRLYMALTSDVISAVLSSNGVKYKHALPAKSFVITILHKLRTYHAHGQGFGNTHGLPYSLATLPA